MNDLDPTKVTWAADPATSAVPLVELDDITPDESLLTELRRTRITTPATRVLLALVVMVGMFLGGALVERWQHKTSSTSSSASSFLAQLRAAAGGASGASGASGSSGSRGAAGGPGGLLGGGNNTFGTVKLVDGTNVYVQDAQGNTIKVTTKPSTTITVTKTGKASELAPGSTVIVQGAKSKDGSSVAATSISQSAGFGGGGFPGGGGASGG